MRQVGKRLRKGNGTRRANLKHKKEDGMMVCACFCASTNPCSGILFKETRGEAQFGSVSFATTTIPIDRTHRPPDKIC